MLFSILKRSFLTVMVIPVSVGTAVAASLLSLSLDISATVSKEFRSFGANIIVQARIRRDSRRERPEAVFARGGPLQGKDQLLAP